ncbi:hypothetical protein OJF2_43420 [Aquisphaera giovannonii]|uniref:Uncharacterized protein n=1 Tax=Aquisphaera giovannonii TaxID=406548 RepID=A0A5B9W6U1_9BACT|nr:hypothetical protein [Aquisphaera giovannonii]QEH35785.1 hypothetical protein OJF2_43420 [Aquisphaera giovannonii]
MSIETPTPDGVLELFRDEIVPREADLDAEYQEAILGQAGAAWDQPFPGVEVLTPQGGPTLMRVTYRRLLDGAADEGDRIRHELRQLWNDIRAAIPSDGQAVFVSPVMTHVDRPEGLEVICSTHGIVRVS